MLESLSAIGFIFIILSLGYLCGMKFSVKIKKFSINLISKVVLILIFLMGIETGWIFTENKVSGAIFFDALALSSLISFCVFSLLIKSKKKLSILPSRSFIRPFLGCLSVVLSFVLGVIIQNHIDPESISSIITANEALYFLIFLVGIDLVSFKLSSVGKKHLILPLLTVVGTTSACLVFSTLSEHKLKDIILVSSGYGWFSLSGPMISSLRGPELGMLAFLTDLFREMISIVFLYLLGARYPHSAIGISGAAALDSALPFIKENCHSDDMDYAIASGFILTLLAPVSITFFAS